jgi:DNA-binding CsgD family transcriptional regulator
MQARVMSAWIQDAPARPATGLAALSARELEVLRLVGQGRSSAEIAALLVRSLKTVETHRRNIQGKLSLDSAAQLVHFATLWLERGSEPIRETLSGVKETLSQP